MYNNIEGKIKGLASAYCVVGILAAVIYGIVLIRAGTAALGIIVIAVGAFFSWVSSWVLYGFGELIDAAKKSEENTQKIIHKLGGLPNGKTASARPSASGIPYELSPNFRRSDFAVDLVKCPKCGQEQKKAMFCANCGAEMK